MQRKSYGLRFLLKRLSKISVLLVTSLLSCSVLAETEVKDDLFELSLEDLGEVTIATRTSRSISEIPSTVYVYKQEQIRSHGWNSLAELVQDVPGVDVVNKGGRGMTLSVRGVGDLNFHGSKTVVMIDGHNASFSSLSSPGFGGFMNQYDILNAKRVEIQIGPGGTLHGANAFGIVINIITMDPEDIDGIEADFIYGSQGEYMPSVRFGSREGDLGFFQSFSSWYQNDSRLSEVAISRNNDGSKLYYDNDLFEEQTSKNIDLHGYIDYDDKLRVGYRYSKVDGGRGTSLLSTEKGNLLIEQPMVYLDFSTGLSDRVTYTLSSHYKKSKMTDADDNYFVDSTRNLVGSIRQESNSFVVDNQFTFFQNNELTWVGGLFLEYSDQRSSSVKVTRKTTDPDDLQKTELKDKEDFDNMATYAQMEWIPNDEFYLVTGFRYVDSENQYPSELIPRLGMRYVLNSQWMAKFNYQKGYRPPAVSDGKQRGITVAGNSDLTSETIDSYELSLVGNPHPQVGIRATYFQSKVSDLIALTAYNGTGNFTSITDNVGQIDVNGIEFEVNYEINDKLKMESTAIYTDSVNNETDERVRTVVPYKLNLTLIARPVENWELVWDNYFRWNPTTDEENALYQGEDAKDWVLSNLTVTNKRSFNVKGLNLMLSIRNMFNQSYGHVDPRTTLSKRPFLTSYHPQEKINVMMGVNYRF